MKIKWIVILWIFPQLCFCSKGGNGSSNHNHSPVVALAATLTSLNPVTYTFQATASDQDLDPLTYSWDFGDGTVKKGTATEWHSFPDMSAHEVKLVVSDAISDPASASITVQPKTVSVALDPGQTFQTMEGFGGFGAQMEYWGSGPFTSSRFVSDLIDDLGLTILRDNIPTNFELVNDNNDPLVTDLSAFNINDDTPGHDGKLADHLQFLRDMKAAGLEKLIVTVWSPPPWMKYNNKVGNGTDQNAAPEYSDHPDSTTNQLRTDMYQEFAEYCVAYVRIIKQETGLDVYAISLQNEPRFSQFYASCVYNGTALRDLIKVVGKRLADEGLTVKIFMPEDVGWLQGVQGMVEPVLNDPVARQYVARVAVHGYPTDGVAPGSADAQTWETMYGWGSKYQIPLWMTETSGYANTMEGALDMARAMYIVLRYGHASAWLFWSLSGTQLDAYTLLSSSGQKSKRYYVSKNFYRYIRPGARRYSASALPDSQILPLGFVNDSGGEHTIVLINTGQEPVAVKLDGPGIPATLNRYVTSAMDDAKAYGAVDTAGWFLVPSASVVTLSSF